MLFCLDFCTGQSEVRESANPKTLADALRGEGYEVYGPVKNGQISFALPGCRDNSATPLPYVQQRAVAYGAQDVEPRIKADGATCSWPADEERVALDQISYHPEDDTFSGWSGRPVPEWTQK